MQRLEVDEIKILLWIMDMFKSQKKSLGILYQPYDANWTILDYFIIHTA